LVAKLPVNSEAETFDFDVRSAAVDRLFELTSLFTVDAVIDSLLDRLHWPCPGARLIDPSAGDGAFLLRALERIETPPGDPGSVDIVQGWELHPLAVRDARERIVSLLTRRGWGIGAAGAAAERMMIEGDFLTSGPERGTFNIIAGNPPYLRHGHLPEYFKELYLHVVADHARGDLLHAFLDRCCDLLPADGAIGFVTADRWLFNETAATLRVQLGRRVGISHLSRLDPESSFYRPKHRRTGSPPRIHPVEIVLHPIERAIHHITGAAISPDEVGREEATTKSLGDVAQVRIAPWLGPVGIFVIDEMQARQLAGADLVPAVDTDDIDPATDVLRSPKRFAIRTTRLAEPTGAVQQHLLAKKELMPKREHSRPYWLPPETITMPLDRPALLVPRIARRLRAIPLPAGVLPVNHNLSVCTNSDGMSLEALAALITSEASQAWLQRNAPRLENGYFSITTKLLRRLPVG
jgi:Eco57I restriction-modification methylase